MAAALQAADGGLTVGDIDSTLVPIRSSLRADAGSPLLCVAPVTGLVLPYLALARHLEPGRSMLGLQAPGLDGRRRPPESVEEFARAHLASLRAAGIGGPYYLVGWSFGALVAYEMARQLERDGQAVGQVALIDTPAPVHRPSLTRMLGYFATHGARGCAPYLRSYLRERRSDDPVGSPLASARVLVASVRAGLDYRSGPYRGRVTVLRTANPPRVLGLAMEGDPTWGWNALAAEVWVEEVPGDHLSVMREPCVRELAARL